MLWGPPEMIRSSYISPRNFLPAFKREELCLVYTRELNEKNKPQRRLPLLSTDSIPLTLRAGAVGCSQHGAQLSTQE